MRAFVALDLPEAALGPITRLQAGLSVGRVVPEENLHLTLAFLGDIVDSAAAELVGALEAAALTRVELALKGLDVFGGRRPGVLFVGAEGGGLARLHDRVVRAAREAGIALPRARFRPHVTIARLGKDMGPKDQRRFGEFLALNGTFALDPMPAETITLYRSHLRHEGAIHEPLAQFPLSL